MFAPFSFPEEGVALADFGEVLVERGLEARVEAEGGVEVGERTCQVAGRVALQPAVVEVLGVARGLLSGG